jgi:hypothetical protein
MVLISYIVLLVVGLVSGKITNAVAKRHVVNSGAIAAVFMVPLFLYQLKLIMSTDKLANAAPEKQGEFIGAMLAPALIMFFVAGVIAIQEAKKHREG